MQKTLNVSPECMTVREVLAEYIPARFGYGTEMAIILRDNGAYLMTLVDMAYRIVFALVCYLLYLLFVFILYIIYHCCYSESKYKRRKNERFTENRTDSGYHKHALSGGLVGLTRGLAAGLISLSFLGSAFFIAAGGTGKGELGAYSFDDERVDFGYSIYRAIDNYGAQGIFKLLNGFQDSEKSPYYLFAADLVFSGRLEDERNGISANIKFRKELGAYSGFARETMRLLLKYGEEDIKPILSGNVSKESMNTIMRIMSEPQFQVEFENLIDDFDAQTYIINLSLAMADSIVCNIDDVSFAASMSETNREMLKVLFKPNYLSPMIPDERAMLSAGVTESAQPYISVGNVFTKNDAKILYRMVVAFMTADKSVDSTLNVVKSILPQMQRLSMLSDGRASEFNPVLSRLYCFLANAYLTPAGYAGVRYQDVAAARVSWVREINSLVSVAENGIALYENVRETDGPIMTKLLSMFDETNVQYAENIQRFDDACAVVTDSALLGQILSTGYMADLLQKQFAAVSENIYIPDEIIYQNTYNEDGTPAARGELYQFLYGLRLLGDKENRTVLEQALDGEKLEFTQLIDMLSKAVTNTDSQGHTLSEYMTESVFLRSLISTVMIEHAGDVLYIPDSVCERDAQNMPVNMIEKSALRQLFDGLGKPTVKDAIVSFVDGESDAAALLNNDEVISLLEMGNGILEGTVARTLIDALGENDFIVLPRALEQPEGWITDGAPGELRKIIRALKVTDIDFSAFLNGNTEEEELVDAILAMDEDGMGALLDSDLLYYTVSEFVLSGRLSLGDDFRLIIPNSTKQIVTDDNVDRLIVRSELQAIFIQIAKFDLSSDSTETQMLRQLARNKGILGDSKIVCASMANYLVTDSDMQRYLRIPNAYVDAAAPDRLETFDDSNIWQTELIALVDALDNLFDLSGSDVEIAWDENTLQNTLSDQMATFNEKDPATGKTKLELCHDSKIILFNLTGQLDRAFDKWNIGITDAVRKAAKDAEGNYTLAELQALTDTMFVLDFEDKNILALSGVALQESVQRKLLELNTPLASYNGRTGLEVIYPSLIITTVITNETDKAITRTPAIIDPALQRVLKTEQGVYSCDEFYNCIEAMRAIGLDTLTGIKDISFDTLETFSENLDTIYASNLIAGILTHSIQQAADNTMLSDHPKAYQQELDIYRVEEVRALILLLNGVSVNSFELGSTEQLRPYLYDETTEAPASYLIAATLSDTLLANPELYVPAGDVIDGIVVPQELLRLLDAYRALTGDDQINEWNVSLSVPDTETAAIVTQSRILRATLTHAVGEANKSMRLWVADSDSSVTIVNRIVLENGSLVRKAEMPVISAEQLGYLLEALLLCAGEGSGFGLPSIEQLKALSEPDLRQCLRSDVLRYLASGYLYTIASNPFLPIESILARFTTENIVDVAHMTYSREQALSAEDCIRSLDEVKSILPI